jgi:signal transduction histidine kinase
MSPQAPYNRRVLLVDDNIAIHEDFQRVLTPRDEAASIDSAAEALFGDVGPLPAIPLPKYQLDFARQGEEALLMVADAMNRHEPYALAFVDMRMPPGWDGLTTIVKLWSVDPKVQIVICTAYSDRSWHEIQTTLTARENWLILKKPFDKVEVLQLAQSLTDKWNLSRIAETREAELEKLVRARTDQLRLAMQVKNEFLGNMSHELRTPLNGVLGMLELAKMYPMTAEQADTLQTASNCAESLSNLVAQILTFHRAEAGTLPIEAAPFDLRKLLAAVEKSYRLRAQHKAVRLQAMVTEDVPAEIVAPEKLLREVLNLLVDNAVKFTKQGVITIRASLDKDSVSIRVVDTGIGMTAENLRLIAMPFGQVDGGLTRKSSGTGIGLVLAKRIVESLGGEVEITSEFGVGTTVHFTALASLPAAVEAVEV